MNEPKFMIEQTTITAHVHKLKASFHFYRRTKTIIEHFYDSTGKWTGCMIDDGWYYNEKDVEVVLAHWYQVENTGFSYDEEHY